MNKKILILSIVALMLLVVFSSGCTEDEEEKPGKKIKGGTEEKTVVLSDYYETMHYEMNQGDYIIWSYSISNDWGYITIRFKSEAGEVKVPPDETQTSGTFTIPTSGMWYMEWENGFEEDITLSYEIEMRVQ